MLTDETLLARIADLESQLEESEATLDAIRRGEVDVVVVSGPPGQKVYTLEGADQVYRAMVEAMHQGAVTLSPDGTILYCNRRFAEMARRPHEKVIGDSLGSLVSPADKAVVAGMLKDCHEGTSKAELSLARPDGTLLPVHAALMPLSLNNTTALCLIITDLTAHKQHQELIEAKHELADADRRKDEFLAMLAHELRNPIAPIRSGLELLGLEGTQAEVIDLMQHQVEHLVRLVDDLLDVSRILRGRIELRKEPVELSTVIARAVETARPLIKAGNQELTVSMTQSLWVDADKVRLTQVLTNLLNNAAKYTDRGGHIHLTAEREENEIVLRVRDNGIGISAEMLPRVFDLFAQADRSIDRSQGGLGIGLTLVRNLVSMHGGTVVARSDGPGQGAEFVVRLPAIAGIANRETPPWKPTLSRKLRLLVVDDNIGSAKILQKMLTRFWGHEVELADDGRSALEVAKSFRPEMILMDLGLPGINGYEATKQLRAQKEFQETLIVALTGYGQSEDRRLSREAGFDEHLVKPASVADLERLFSHPKLSNA